MNNYGLGILIQAKDQASATFQKVEKNFESLSKKSDDMAARMQASSKTFYAGVGMMGAGAGMLAVPASLAKSTFETQKALGELASLGIRDLGSVEKAARSFSDAFSGTTTDQFISAAYDIKSGISSLSDEAVGQYTQLAALTGKATKASTEQMTSLFATAYGIYKDYYSDLSDFQFGEMFSGGLSQSVQQFKTTGQDMQAAIENLGASATSSLVPMEEQLSVLGMLQATMSGSEAGTKYKAFLKSVAKAGDTLGVSMMDANNQLLPLPEILDRFKSKYGETLDAVEKQQIQKAFGDFEAVSFLDLFYGKSELVKDNVNALSGAMKNGTAVTNEMAAAMNQDMGAQAQIQAQRWQNLKETLGGAVLPLLTPLMEKAGSIIKKFSDWAAKNKPLAQTIMKIVMAVGALLLVGGAILTFLGGVGMLSAGLASLPVAAGALGGVVAAIWPVITVVAALAAIGYLLYKAWTTNFLGIRDIVTPVLAKLKAAFSSFMSEHGDTLMAFARTAGKVVIAVTAVSGSIRIVKGVVSGAITVWRTAAGAVRSLYSGFMAAKAYAGQFARSVLSAARSTLTFAKNAAVQAVQGLKTFALSLGAAIKKAVLFSVTLIRRAVTAVASFAVSMATSAVTAISAFAAALVPAIAGAWAFTAALLANPVTWIVLAIIALIAAIVLLVKNWDKVKEVAARVWTAVVEFIKSAFQKIKSVFVGIYQAVADAFSKAWEWLKGFIVQWWPTILAVFTGGFGLLFGLVVQNWDRITTYFRTVMAAIAALISGVIDWLAMRWNMFKNAVLLIWQGISNVVSTAAAAIRNVVSGVITGLQMRWQQFRAVVAAVWNAIASTVAAVISGIQLKVQGAVDAIKGIWEGLKAAVAAVWDGIIQKIGAAIAVIRSKLAGLVPAPLRGVLGSVGIRVPAASKGKGKGFATGGYVARTGGVSAVLHEGEVITPAPAVRKIVRFADSMQAGSGQGRAASGSGSTTVHNHIHISLPNVREVDRQSIDELADIIAQKLAYMQKRKREASFANDFNPHLGVAR